MRSIIKSKVFAVLLCISMLMTLVPAINVQAASDDQVKASISADSQTVNEDGTVKVTISLEGIPYQGKVNPTDVILVIDRSESMDTKLDKMKEAAKVFIDSIDMSIHRIGIVVYDTNVSSYVLSTDKTKLKEYVDKIEYQGATNTSEAINESIKLLKNRRSNAQGAVVLMTDGGANCSGNPGTHTGKRVALAAAVEAAEKAKASGYVFYTVALCDDPNDDANLCLKKMATSEADHYFTNVDGLVSIYKQISAKIGYANAKDVVISQYISDQFEYVTGSADNNIPKPYISGQKMIWKMNQLGQGLSTLSYEIKVKENTVPGTYKHVSSGSVVYTDYNGSTRSILLDKLNITVNKHAPQLLSINQTDFDTKGGENVLIQGKYMQSGATVKIGNSIISNAVISNDTVAFTMPSHTTGTDFITVTNPDQQISNSITVNYISSAPMPSLKINPSSGLEKTSVKVTLSGVKFTAKKEKQLTITVGGTAVKVLSYDKTTGETSFYVPDTFSAGTVDVVIKDKDGKVYTTQYEYTPKVIAGPEITSISPDNCQEYSGVKVTITGKNFKKNRTKVTVGGNTVSLLSIDSTSLVFNVPDSFAASVQKVEVTRTDLNKMDSIEFTYTTKIIPDEPEITLVTPDSCIENESIRVTVQGKNFKKNRMKVTVGGKTVELLSCDNTQLVFNVPDDFSKGVQKIIVTRTDLNKSASADFTYTETPPKDPPKIIAMTPDNGIENTSTRVTITGENFKKGKTKVLVGGKAVELLSISTEEIIFNVPDTFSAGAQTITVLRTDSSKSATATFVYTPKPTPVNTFEIKSVSPASGIVGEATRVTITGVGIKKNGKFKVLIGGKELEILSVSETSIVGTVPTSLPVGTYSIDVTNYDGTKKILTNAYEYKTESIKPSPVVNNISLVSGCKFVIDGTGFKPGSKKPTVTFGTQKVELLSHSDTEIIFNVSDVVAGTYNIVITNSYGNSTTVPYTVN